MDMAKNKILLKNAFIHPISQIPFHGDLLIENGKLHGAIIAHAIEAQI